MIPESEFTEDRMGEILGSGLRWLSDDHDVFVDIAWLDSSNDELGKYLARGWTIDVVIDGKKHNITRQTLIDGVQRQLEWEGATPEKLAQFNSPYCMECLWGADDMASSVLCWGLGIHEAASASR